MNTRYLLIGAAWSCVVSIISQAAPSDLDPSFGESGIARAAVGLTGNSPRMVALQPDGKIVVVGLARDNQSSGSYGYDVGLVRYTTEGGLDPSFSGDGKLATDIGSSGQTYTDDWGNAVVVQDDGKIVVAGTSRSYVKSGDSRFEWYMWDLMLIRYLPDGSLDPDFADAGKMILDISGSGTVPEGFNDVALQSDGKIIGVGYTMSGYDNRFLVARFNTDGSLDPTFGNGGMVIVNFSGNTLEDAYSVEVLEDDSILAVGRGIKPDGNSTVSILKLTADGQLDSSFNGSGKLTKVVGYSSRGKVVAVDNDGKFVVGGGMVESSGGDESMLLLRYNADGTLDPGFGINGVVTTHVPEVRYQTLTGMAIDGDGNITGAATYMSPQKIGLFRWKADGTVDSGFGSDGLVLPAIAGATDTQALNLVQQADGKLLLGAMIRSVEMVDHFSVLRFDGPGSAAPWDEGFVAISEGWREVPWLGSYAPLEAEWIFHVSMGYLQLIPESTPENAILYSPVMGWYWTNSVVGPWCYSYDPGEWTVLGAPGP